MTRSSDKVPNPLGDYVLLLGAGFAARERPQVLAAMATLTKHLSRWHPDDVSLEVSLQDRGRREQRVTLRATLPGLTPLVAVADHPNVSRALHQAKHEMSRQLDEQRPVRERGRDPVRYPATGVRAPR